MSDEIVPGSVHGFEGQRALVTGAANGIGLATARWLAAMGAQVTGLDVEPVDDPDVEGVQCDIADLPALRSLLGTFGFPPPFDVLVNVAGVFDPAPALEVGMDSFRRVLAINLDAAVSLMQLCARGMVERGYGRIVNVTSIHAFVGEPGSVNYDASKAGLTAAARTFAIEVAAAGVLVNCVAPGFVRTRMSVVDGRDELESEEFRTVYTDGGRLPIRRPAEASEIAAAAGWLASPQNTYIVGQTVVVDGGVCATF
ncbi:MAG: SDR family NAD(P)-dependent oxidoreductase [Dehalococcoidia bacterium]